MCLMLSIVLLFIVVSFMYFTSREIGFFFDKNLFYRKNKIYLMQGSFDEFVYVILLREKANEIAFVKIYDNFGIRQTIVKKSKLTEVER